MLEVQRLGRLVLAMVAVDAVAIWIAANFFGGMVRRVILALLLAPLGMVLWVAKR